MILRDFALVLEGKNGEPITAEVYFEDALEEQKASTNVAFNKNRIRRVFKDIFRNRNCVTLPFPSDDICIQKGSNLREKFEKELGTLGQTIGKKLQ